MSNTASDLSPARKIGNGWRLKTRAFHMASWRPCRPRNGRRPTRRPVRPRIGVSAGFRSLSPVGPGVPWI